MSWLPTLTALRRTLTSDAVADSRACIGNTILLLNRWYRSQVLVPALIQTHDGTAGSCSPAKCSFASCAACTQGCWPLSRSSRQSAPTCAAVILGAREGITVLSLGSTTGVGWICSSGAAVPALQAQQVTDDQGESVLHPEIGYAHCRAIPVTETYGSVLKHRVAWTLLCALFARSAALSLH